MRKLMLEVCVRYLGAARRRLATNDAFSHCGVDAFMLVKVGDTWRITQLADTQRQDGCTRKD